jgi:hypothetical protein
MGARQPWESRQAQRRLPHRQEKGQGSSPCAWHDAQARDDDDDGGSHGEDNGGGDEEEECAEVKGGESVSGGRLETVRA